MTANKTKVTDDSGREENRTRKRVSDLLRDGRLSKDQELQDVSDLLRIRLPFLQAIEAGQYKDLPGTTYAIGFVRTYASYLGLDSSALVEQFKQEAAELERRTELHFPEPLPGGRVPSGAIFFVCIFLAVVFYGAWMLVSSDGKPMAEVVSELPENLAEMIGFDVDDEEEVEIVEEAPAVEVAPVVVAEEPSVVEAPIVTESNIPTEEVDLAVEEAVEIVEDVVVATTEATEAAVEGVVQASAEDPSAAINETAPSVTVEAVPMVEGAVDATEVTATTVEDVAEEIVETEVADVPATQETTAIAETVTEVEETIAPIVEGAPVVEETMVEEEVAVAATTDEVNVEATSANDPIPSPPSLPQVERAPRVYGEENTTARVIITANTPTWVEVTATSGELILTRLLGENDSFRVPNVAGLTLVTGNAGGLNFTVDGQAVPDIGPIGSVRRDVLLDPDSLKRGPDQ